MKINITKKVEVSETIDVDFPFYYKHCFDGVVICGKIEENKNSSIMIQEDDQSISFELEVNYEHASKVSCYFSKEYKGTEKDYLMAKHELLAKIKTL